ncbi:GTP-binding protein [uncultured Algibacter sp.]|uniref:GTP-binding protein n=1 Tax=uncultured Algibacter sp. TaxID=298659 RepID=UPI00261AD735|nr:GTP-binding protein [uncultured Algibacter sp.]
MATTNDIVLRPRFKLEINENNKSILKRFKISKNDKSEFITTCVDNHVFIKFPKEKQHFWSPQLHLEIDSIDENSSLLHGLYGPNPTVWTMFMFLHFMVAGLFIAFGIWAYTNYKLNTEYTIQISIMILMILLWFVLYFGGRIGRDTSKKDMFALRDFMNDTIFQKNL